MSVLKYFKNTPDRPMGDDRGPVAPCRPSHGRHDPNVIFFGICKEVPGPGEGACRPPGATGIDGQMGGTA